MNSLIARLRYFFTIIKLQLTKGTGVTTRKCTFCKSENTRLYKKEWLFLPYEIPKAAKKYKDQLLRRDNGVCLECGLEQSFYKFSEKACKVFYDLGLDVLSADNEFGTYPPSAKWRIFVFENNYRRRIQRWDDYFQSRGIFKLGPVLHLRHQYGDALNHLASRYGAEPYGMEMTHTCEKYVREHLPIVHILKGDLSARIDIEPNLTNTFDLIICFHTLTHSMDLSRDLETLRSLLANRGRIIFCDEISKKFNNPFHMIHPNEEIFVRILSKYFNQFERIDDCGVPAQHITKYTVKGDVPDFIAWNE